MCVWLCGAVCVCAGSVGLCVCVAVCACGCGSSSIYVLVHRDSVNEVRVCVSER